VKYLIIPNKLVFWLGCWLLLAPSALFALDPANPYSVQLPDLDTPGWLACKSDQFHCQTRDGRIVVRDQKALVVFDGIRFNLITLPSRPEFPSQNISSLSSSREGGLCLESPRVPSGLRWSAVAFLSSINHGWDAGMNVIAIHEADDGSIWIGSDKVQRELSKGIRTRRLFRSNR